MIRTHRGGRRAPAPALLTHLLLSTALVFAIGCSSTSGPEPEPAAEPPAPPPAKAKSMEDSHTIALAPVYFATDDATLRGDARDALEQAARAIKAHPDWGVVTIEGHCDERGSDAYNRALGERRAKSVERFLVEQGVPRDRLTTRSFGSREPAVTGHDESAWRMNRRSELEAESGDLASNGDL